jgi:hypothetical protein
MSTRERVRVMLEWFGRRQTIALPINSVVGCLIATILLMILSENNVRTHPLPVSAAVAESFGLSNGSASPPLSSSPKVAPPDFCK